MNSKHKHAFDRDQNEQVHFPDLLFPLLAIMAAVLFVVIPLSEMEENSDSKVISGIAIIATLLCLLAVVIWKKIGGYLHTGRWIHYVIWLSLLIFMTADSIFGSQIILVLGGGVVTLSVLLIISIPIVCGVMFYKFVDMAHRDLKQLQRENKQDPDSPLKH